MTALREAIRLFWAEADASVRTRIALALALVVAAGMMAALAPIALKLVVDSFSGDSSSTTYLTPALLIAGYVLSQYLARAATELRVLVQGGADRRIQRSLSRRLFGHIMRLPLRFHLDRKSGAIGQTLTMGLAGYQQVLQQLLYTVIPVVVEITTIFAVLVHLDHPAYLVILGTAAVLYFIAYTVGAAHIAGPSRAVSSASIDAHAVLTDTLLNYETVKYFNAESAVTGRYDCALLDTESHWGRFYRVLALNGLAVATIFGVSLGAALAFAAREVARGTMTVGDFVLVNAYVLQIVRPLEMLGVAARSLSQGVAYLHRMLELFREKTEPAPALDHLSHDDAGGELIFDHVTFSYRPERRVLEDVSFIVPAGRTVAIVGVSGSGKSSLIRLLFRLYEPDAGRVLLDGRPISEISLESLRHAIAVVPQDTVLFNDTIGHNIGFGKQGCTREEIEHAASLAHLHEFISSLPDKYDTVVGERGLKLSGGEKQRVAIARAALKRPRIYVFDEATSSLDSRTEGEILRNLIDLSRLSTTLIIAHRLSTVVHADEIVVLDRGVIAERGTHAELLQRRGPYAVLWRAQQSAPPERGESAASVA